MRRVAATILILLLVSSSFREAAAAGQLPYTRFDAPSLQSSVFDREALAAALPTLTSPAKIYRHARITFLKMFAFQPADLHRATIQAAWLSAIAIGAHVISHAFGSPAVGNVALAVATVALPSQEARQLRQWLRWVREARELGDEEQRLERVVAGFREIAREDRFDFDVEVVRPMPGDDIPSVAWVDMSGAKPKIHFLHRYLMQLTDAEIAFVVGHELGHALNEDAAFNKILVSMGRLPRFQRGYSLIYAHKETEADKRSLTFLDRLGYGREAGVSTLEKAAAYSRGETHYVVHPELEDLRLKVLQDRIQHPDVLTDVYLPLKFAGGVAALGFRYEARDGMANVTQRVEDLFLLVELLMDAATHLYGGPEDFRARLDRIFWWLDDQLEHLGWHDHQHQPHNAQDRRRVLGAAVALATIGNVQDALAERQAEFPHEFLYLDDRLNEYREQFEILLAGMLQADLRSNPVRKRSSRSRLTGYFPTKLKVTEYFDLPYEMFQKMILQPLIVEVGEILPEIEWRPAPGPSMPDDIKLPKVPENKMPDIWYYPWVFVQGFPEGSPESPTRRSSWSQTKIEPEPAPVGASRDVQTETPVVTPQPAPAHEPGIEPEPWRDRDVRVATPPPVLEPAGPVLVSAQAPDGVTESEISAIEERPRLGRLLLAPLLLLLLAFPITDYIPRVSARVVEYGTATMTVPHQPPLTNRSKAGEIYSNDLHHYAGIVDQRSQVTLQSGGWVGADPNVFPLGSDIRVHLKDGRIVTLSFRETGRLTIGNRINLPFTRDSPRVRRNFVRLTDGDYVEGSNGRGFEITSKKPLPKPVTRYSTSWEKTTGPLIAMWGVLLILLASMTGRLVGWWLARRDGGDDGRFSGSGSSTFSRPPRGLFIRTSNRWLARAG